MGKQGIAQLFLPGIPFRILVNICECLPVDAAVLNNVAHTFGLMDTVKRVLDNRKSQTDQGEEQFLNTLAGNFEI